MIADEPATLQVRSSRTVHHGMVWDVRRDAVDLGDGQTVTREVVDHTGAVGVVVLDAEDRVLLLRQYRHPVRSYLWEPPAGLLDVAGEDPQVAAARELAEEIGIVGVVPTPWGGGVFGDEHFELIGRCYHVVHDGPHTFADGEVIATKWVNRAELDHLLRNEDVVHDSIALMLDRLTVAD